MSHIPPRKDHVEDKEGRFCVCAPSSLYLQLQLEAIQRGTDPWALGGSVLTAWLEASRTTFGTQDQQPEKPSSPPSSPLARKGAGQ